MSAGGALSLRDIHLPAEPGWWPPAPGWWLLAAVVAGLAWLILRWLRRRVQRRRRRRLLTAAMDALLADCPAESRPLQLLAGLSELLRRACRSYAPGALGLAAEEWLEFLDGDDPLQPFSRGPGRLLLDGPYRPTVDAGQVLALLPLVRARLQRLAETDDA